MQYRIITSLNVCVMLLSVCAIRCATPPSRMPLTLEEKKKIEEDLEERVARLIGVGIELEESAAR